MLDGEEGDEDLETISANVLNNSATAWFPVVSPSKSAKLPNPAAIRENPYWTAS